MSARLAVALFAILTATPALAYIGPGSGISLLSALWGVLAGIVLTIGAILIWPVRYAIRRMRRKRREAADWSRTGSEDGRATGQVE